MHPSAPDLSGRTEAFILPYLDDEVAASGFDPRSHYAESFWLPILGPSTLWLLRSVANRFDVEPDGFTMQLEEASASIGIRSNGGRNNAFQRSLHRLVGFNMGRTVDEQTLEVRRVMPILHAGQVRRLSPRLQRQHHEAVENRESHREEDTLRASKVAFTLLQLGDSPDLVEQQLVSWGVDPATSHDAVNQAWASKARADRAASIPVTAA
jgi:hypothetical protein